MESPIPHMTSVREKEKKEIGRMRYGLHDDGRNKKKVGSRKARNRAEKKDPLTLR